MEENKATHLTETPPAYDPRGHESKIPMETSSDLASGQDISAVVVSGVTPISFSGRIYLTVLWVLVKPSECKF